MLFRHAALALFQIRATTFTFHKHVKLPFRHDACVSIQLTLSQDTTVETQRYRGDTTYPHVIPTRLASPERAYKHNQMASASQARARTYTHNQMASAH
jgi:hypothetical protein